MPPKVPLSNLHAISSFNSFTFTRLLAAISRLPFSPTAHNAGLQLHAAATKTSNYTCDVFVSTSLVTMYSKIGLLSDARKLFDEMPVRNTVSWAAMISGYTDKKRGEEAFELLKVMLRDGECEVNEFVLTSVAIAVASEEFGTRTGGQVHALAEKSGLFSFVAVKNSIVTMYAKCGVLDDALLMFNLSADRNPITWSAMVTGFAQNARSLDALRLFSQMHSNAALPSEFTFVGVLNACSDSMAVVEGKQAHAYLLKLGFEAQLYVKSALVDMYAKCGNLPDARKGFEGILEPDAVLWTTMISAYVQNGENEDALSSYCRIKIEGVTPNDLTLASVLRACSSLGSLELGRRVHSDVVKFGFTLETPIGCALSNFYAKCGDIDGSYLAFCKMPFRDVVAWNTIISAFAQNGRDNDALHLFEEMKTSGTKPDRITFINLLCACSHMGLVERGWEYFKLMSRDYGLVPVVHHYACMVDILTRAGLLEEAKTFIESIPINHGTGLWRILLGACMNHRKFDIGVYAGERLMELGTLSSSAYILLSNIYVASGRRENIEQVRGVMKFRGVNKEPGCSWIEVDKRTNVFLVRDEQHPMIREVNADVKRLHKHMKDED